MRGILLRSSARSLLIELCKSPVMIAGSDNGSDTDPFADIDKDEDQTEENWAPLVQSACANLKYLPCIE